MCFSFIKLSYFIHSSLENQARIKEIKIIYKGGWDGGGQAGRRQGEYEIERAYKNLKHRKKYIYFTKETINEADGNHKTYVHLSYNI